MRAARDVASVLATHPGLHVASWNVGQGEIRLRGIEAGEDGHSLSIRVLRLPLPRVVGLVDAALADPAAEGNVTAEDVTVTIGTTTVKLKRIDLGGTSLGRADLDALLDPKAPDGLEARLRKLSAKAVAIPEIAVDDATPGSQRHGLVRDVALANVVAGKASAASAKEVTFALTDGDQAANVASGPIEVANVDLAGLAHVATTRRVEESEPLKPLLDKLAISALKVSNVTRNAGLEIGSITATGVAARPLARALDGALVAAPGSGSDTALFYADLASSVAVATLDVADVASHGKTGDDETRLSAAQLGLKDVGAGKVGGLHLRDFRLEGTYAKLGVGSADIGTFAIPKPGADARTAARPGTLDVGRITVDIAPRGDKPQNDKPPSDLSFTIDHLALAQEGGPTSIPTSGSATVEKLGFDLAADGGTATHLLHEMGYRHATVSGAFSSSYDAGAQELTVHKLTVNEPAMGSLQLALRLANVSQDVLSTDPQTVQASAIAVLAKSLDLKIVDAGLFEKALALKAQQDGIALADERAFGIDFFQNKLPLVLGGGAGISQVGKAVAQFIAEPKSLHVSIDSKQGLGVGAMGMLADPGALLDTLDIHATANE